MTFPCAKCCYKRSSHHIHKETLHINTNSCHKVTLSLIVKVIVKLQEKQG